MSASDLMPSLAVSLTPIGQPRSATQQSEKWLNIKPVSPDFGRAGEFSRSKF
jgi:hypothetical protein